VEGNEEKIKGEVMFLNGGQKKLPSAQGFLHTPPKYLTAVAIVMGCFGTSILVRGGPLWAVAWYITARHKTMLTQPDKLRVCNTDGRLPVYHLKQRARWPILSKLNVQRPVKFI